MKKINTFLILLAFLGLSVNSAFAQFGGGDGSLATPYQIGSVEHLAQLAADVNGGTNYNATYFILTADLDLSVAPYNYGEGWVPIGKGGFPFSGNFNGNGKKISNLFINAPMLYRAGLFAIVENGVIENLGVENVNITASSSAGAVAGDVVKNSSITNCYSTGNINGGSSIGGVIGSVYNNCSITNCYSEVEVSGTYGSAGGVSGSLGNSSMTNCYSTGNVSGGASIGGVSGNVSGYASMTNCYSTGKVSGTDASVGGVAGGAKDNCSLTNCYSEGDVSGIGWVGGVAGSMNDACYIKDSHYTGTVSGSTGIGGVVGYFKGKCSITDCYSTGEVIGTNSNVGGVAGRGETDCSIRNCYTTGEVSGGESVGGVIGYAKDNCDVTNCYTTGDVTAPVSGGYQVGGLAGSLETDCSISNSYATGNAIGDGYVGGVVGSGGIISNCAALNLSVKGSASGRITMSANALANNIAFDGILNKADNTTWSRKGLNAEDGEDMTKATINDGVTLGGRFAGPTWTTQPGTLPGLFGNTVVMPAHLRISGTVYITTESLPNGKENTPYTETLTAEGSPIMWSIIANTLPTGLTLDANTGVISGTPTAAGTFAFTVKAANSISDNSKTLSITIDGVGIVETHCNASLRMYPNPTTGVLNLIQETIDNGKLTIDNVQIVDIMGRTLNNYQLSILNSQLIIDISHLPAGVYFVKISTEAGEVVKKVMKY